MSLFNYRFALAYEKYNALNIDIGFLSLDPDRFNDSLTDGKFNDLGDDIKSDSNDVNPVLYEFLKCRDLTH